MAAKERVLLRADILLLVRIDESDAALASFMPRGSFEALKRSLVIDAAALLPVLFKAEMILLGPCTGGNSCRDLNCLILGFLGEKPAGEEGSLRLTMSLNRFGNGRSWMFMVSGGEKDTALLPARFFFRLGCLVGALETA